MTFQSFVSYSLKTSVVCCSLVAAAPVPRVHAADDSTVSTLKGTWGGSGRISYTDGSSEAIRCTAYYTGGGNELRMVIQCKSAKNPIHIRSKLHIEGGHASGDWEERTFNASGTASGKVSGNKMSLNISGGGFNGSMSVSFGKSSHSVSISTQGIAMSKATMSFSRQ